MNQLIKFLIFIPTAFVSLLSGCDQKDKQHQLANENLKEMVFVEGGSFMMGDFGTIIGTRRPYSPDKHDKPLHKVTLDSFSISKYRITWGQYNRYRAFTGKPVPKKFDFYRSMGEGDSHFKRTRDDYPAAVLWQDAKDYCLWLGGVSGHQSDLPTEAQWEYAARSRGKNYIMANEDNSWREESRGEKINFAQTREPVGSYPPNPLGLYDMMGNGRDWVNDWYSDNYYKSSPEYNPKGPEYGEKKVLRGAGGSDYWNNLVVGRWARPKNDHPENVPIGEGFRCVINEGSPL